MSLRRRDASIVTLIEEALLPELVWFLVNGWGGTRGTLWVFGQEERWRRRGFLSWNIAENQTRDRGQEAANNVYRAALLNVRYKSANGSFHFNGEIVRHSPENIQCIQSSINLTIRTNYIYILYIYIFEYVSL